MGSRVSYGRTIRRERAVIVARLTRGTETATTTYRSDRSFMDVNPKPLFARALSRTWPAVSCISQYLSRTLRIMPVGGASYDFYEFRFFYTMAHVCDNVD